MLGYDATASSNKVDCPVYVQSTCPIGVTINAVGLLAIRRLAVIFAGVNAL